VKVLSIDGGGIRGLIPALVLAEIEQRTGRRVADLFDLIAGTSTGGILACALTRPGDDGTPMYTAEELTGLYVTEGPKIFHHSLLHTVESAAGIFDEKYESTGLRHALDHYLGDGKLSQTLIPIFVTAYDIERRGAFFFRTGAEWDYRLSDVALATAAAPTYFEPALVSDLADTGEFALVDGGVFASNPSLCAYIDLVKAGTEPNLEVLCSLGTGEQIHSFEYEKARGWGLLEWAHPVIDVMLSSQAETVGFGMEHLLGERYVRLTRKLTIARDAMDDASPQNLADLRSEAERLIADESRRIDDLCGKLTA
jgi:patatin-like phospholipase/acyl hydrolase